MIHTPNYGPWAYDDPRTTPQQRASRLKLPWDFMARGFRHGAARVLPPLGEQLQDVLFASLTRMGWIMSFGKGTNFPPMTPIVVREVMYLQYPARSIVSTPAGTARQMWRLQYDCAWVSVDQDVVIKRVLDAWEQSRDALEDVGLMWNWLSTRYTAENLTERHHYITDCIANLMRDGWLIDYRSGAETHVDT